MKFIPGYLSIVLCLTALFGDYLVFKSKFAANSIYFRAIADSLVHGCIGFVSAVLFFSHNLGVSGYASIFNILLCTFMASAIDIDHVLVAKSFDIKDLTTLKQRGIFHCTTFWILTVLSLISYSYVFKKIDLYMSSFMMTVAFITHHIRDGNRRGLWFYPLGHTAPIPNFYYVFLIMLIPNILAYTYNCTKHVFYRDTVISNSFLV